ncbi:monovalent cation/H(+) antiporter subunit G [Paenibacillus typhae]|uniref:Multisubunit sodium/proton antiporter, MrpG subunit n=1 Tax=Paenibacillus typhae TaxID=1174501 RepID=A0A1G8GEG8_9BACL|nr:monovalent cation/H(+) antiporter subunit G [Paenibacillus typhae]SDH92736.1 multisubunit sodium/proton antiporter, MrpG subunit [Paenibacillus typhae]
MTGELFSSILVVVGAVFCAISAFGLVRLPDVYLRSHAATKSATFGVLCLLGGGFLYFWFKDGSVSVKLLLAILFVFITSPVAGHLNGRAAYRSGVPLWKDSVQNDLLPLTEESREKR